MLVLMPDRRRRVVSRAGTQLGDTIPAMENRHPRNRLQGQNVGRDDGQKLPQELA
jgi:hypothetical protein